MVVFGDILHEECDDSAFYRRVDIDVCGLAIDGMTLRQNLYKHPRNSDRFIGVMRDVFNKNNLDCRHNGRPGTNAFFIDDDEQEVLFCASEDSEDTGYHTCIVARTGYLVKLDISGAGGAVLCNCPVDMGGGGEPRTGVLMEPPVRYQMLEWRCQTWDRWGQKSNILAIPFFETCDVGPGDAPIEEILCCIRWYSGGAPLIRTPCGMAIADIPAHMRGFYIRKNRPLWWAANRIAATWSKVYWDPSTEVGRRRLARRFLE